MTMVFYGVCEAPLAGEAMATACNARVTRDLTAGERHIDRCDQHR